MKKIMCVQIAAIALLATTGVCVAAETDEPTTHDLIARIEALTKRIRQLESTAQSKPSRTAEQADTTAANLASHENLAWAEKIKVAGDFRYRVENIKNESKPDRNRNRIRARAKIVAKPLDGLELGLGLASGGDDPVSTNQTLGGGGSTKGMNLDLAYFKYSKLANVGIVAGKFKNVLVHPGKSGLLWDGDWNPEGLGVSLNKDRWFARAMGSWLESDSKKSNTEFSYALQAGFNNTFDSGAKLTAGITYVDLETTSKGSFFGDSDDFFGNSFDANTNTYVYDYKELELFADFSFQLAGRSASVFVDYVTNQDAGEFDTGFAFGLKVGTAKAAGGWSLGWMYKDIEADAVFGLLADSDFGGGGTDSKGHVFKGSYALAKNMNANITYFANETDTRRGLDKDFNRLQLDMNFQY